MNYNTSKSHTTSKLKVFRRKHHIATIPLEENLPFTNYHNTINSNRSTDKLEQKAGIWRTGRRRSRDVWGGVRVGCLATPGGESASPAFQQQQRSVAIRISVATGNITGAQYSSFPHSTSLSLYKLILLC